MVAAARHLQPLISVLTPIYWTTAVELGGAVNGHTLTHGHFRREVQVEFATGNCIALYCIKIFYPRDAMLARL